jgi:hypothetical protein
MSRIIASRLAERIEVGPLDERGLLLSGHGEAYCRDVERALDIKLPSDYRSILANVGGFVAYDAVVVRPGADALPIDVVFGESKRRGRDLVAVCREFARRLPQSVIPIADNLLGSMFVVVIAPAPDTSRLELGSVGYWNHALEPAEDDYPEGAPEWAKWTPITRVWDDATQLMDAIRASRA